MKSVTLPFFAATVSIGDALEQLRTDKRSGLIIAGDRGNTLLHTGDLLYARAKGIATVGKVGTGRPVILLQDRHIAQFGLNSKLPESTGKEFEQYLQNFSHRYALVSTSGDSATVVTASELDFLALTLTGGYECDGTPTHYFPLPRVTAGQTCPRWPICSRPDGKKPQVRPVP
jgi:hypothetical protein